MSEPLTLTHRFVDVVPRELDEGVVYVSIKYATVIHSCACGCGNRVVTPLSPAQWTLIFDGRTVTLDPSIGIGAFPCRSHYWIRSNKIVWARRLAQHQIEAVRKNDLGAAFEYFDKGNSEAERVTNDSSETAATPPAKGGFVGRIMRWLGR